MGALRSHYDDRYFRWQSPVGEFGGWANLPMFEGYVSRDSNVVDFGCGGGYLLRNLECAGKIGVDVNGTARRKVEEAGIRAYASSGEIEDGWADLVVSDNALEHTLHPLQELLALHPKLKRGGRMVFVVPCESVSYGYVPGDINQHLYSWSPMCLGNLFTRAGFAVEESKPYIHKWPPMYRTIARLGGRRVFDASSRIYGHLRRSWFQVRIVAHKE